MAAFSSQLFELLKSYVLTKSHLTHIQASDCKVLSAQISDKTSHTVSETTLKRIYGFAMSKFKPSLFTIDVLSTYCGYNGWDDFCKKQDKQYLNTGYENVNWDSLSQKASKITNFTLQALKNKSGIPFNQSIKRAFLDKHLDEFLKGDNTATVLISPPSYGKTIALCHWIDNKLAHNINTGSGDIILFFSSNALMNVLISGKDFNDWLLALLGYTLEEDIISLLDNTKRKEGYFYLIIDGLDEHMFKNNWFQVLLDQLMDIFAFYQAYEWFKIILTMRSANWINNRHILDHENPKWFTGNIVDTQVYSNVPLFNAEETSELCRNINPDMQTAIATEVASSFNHPLYFQFYYKQYKDNFLLSNIDHTSIYDLIANFIFNKVYLGHYATDKTLLIKGLVENMDFKRKIYDIDKLKINGLLNQYNQAYKELLSIGFLKETNTSNDAQFNTHIQFANNNFMELAVANKLLYDNHNVFNHQFIKTVNQSFANNELKIPLIKWGLVHAIRHGQQTNLSVVAKADLNPKEHLDLVIFIGDLLNKAYQGQANAEDSISNYFKKDCDDELFQYFLGLELVSSEYKKALQLLFKFELSNYKKILLYTSQAVIAIHQLDISALESILVKINGFSQEDFNKFIINPADCITTLYYFFKYGIVKKDFFSSVTKFYFNSPQQSNQQEHKPAEDLLYLLTGYSLLLCQKPQKVLRYVNALKQIFIKDTAETAGYSFLLKILTADAYFSLGKTKEFKAIHDHIADSFKAKESSFTPVMKLFFYSLKIKKAILNGEYHAIPGHLKNLNLATEKSGTKFARIFTTNLLISKPAIVTHDETFYKQLAYNNAKTLRESGVNAEIFSFG